MEDFPDIVAVMVPVVSRGAHSIACRGHAAARGSIVAVPLAARLTLGVVWGAARDMIAHNRLKDIERVFDTPPFSDELLKLVDWVARYTLAPPGLVLRSVLRSSEALEPERPVSAYRLVGAEPARMTDARLRVLDCLADGQIGSVGAGRGQRRVALGDRGAGARRHARAA